MKKIAAKTLGCKTNQYETEAILSQLPSTDYDIVDLSAKADVYIINTCCVTKKAEAKSRYEIRKIIRKRPSSKIIVTGCYVNLNAKFLQDNKDRLFLFTNEKKPHIVNEILKDKAVKVINDLNNYPEIGLERPIYHSRIPLKIQDGCNFNCAYCILPEVRGKPRSREPQSVLNQVNKLVEQNIAEIVLTGINLGLYGLNITNYSLVDLIDEISLKTSIKQIRISSLEPMFFTEKLITYFANNPIIAPHFHISLQSGCDRVLKAMNRTYLTDEIEKILNEIKSIIPYAAIGADIIVGFPGENESDYEKTYKFIKNNPIDYLHIFRYSKRPGTNASQMGDQIHSKIKKKRLKKLIKLGEKKKNLFIQTLIENRVSLKAVAERKVNGIWQSVSDHYINTEFVSNEVQQGELVDLIPIKYLNQNYSIKSKIKK